MTCAPGRPLYPSLSPKPHQQGVFHFTETGQWFATEPLPEMARKRFDSYLAFLESNPPEQQTTVRLIISGEIEQQIVVGPGA